MKKICAWCNKNLGENYHDNNDEIISHGICSICSICLKEYFDVDKPENLKKILDKFESPVMVVDSNGNVLSANNIACEKIGKKYEEISSLRAGVVMDCENSILPGGCGGNEKCEGCLIRNTVMETLKTGISISKKMVKLYKLDTYGDEALEMNISTEKINDTVLIRIDEID